MVMIREATEADCWLMAPLMRPEDCGECLTASGHTPLEALMDGLRLSEEAFSFFLEDGSPCGMFGLSKQNDGVAAIWMLGTIHMTKAGAALMRETPRILDRWCEKYPVLGNYVDGRNHQHIRWLNRLGCQFFGAVLIGGQPFLGFTYRKKGVRCGDP